MNKPFDIHGWDYANGHELVNGLIREFIRQQPKSEKYYSLFLEDYALFGGKAFGLDICRQIARHSERLLVPESIGGVLLSRQALKIPGVENIIRDWLSSSLAVMIRSSALDEDWIDPRSGVQESRSIRTECAWTEIITRINRDECMVVQRLVWGIGFVVDVGYSELLGKPIARIAHGNKAMVPYGDPYSSATWDGQSRVGIYDAETGEPIVPLTAYKEFATIAPDLVRELVSGLKRIGINFGVQFELVIDPQKPEEWHLVQLRPSPENIRGMDQTPETRGELLCTTGKVSKAGEAEGLLSYAGDMMTPEYEGRVMAWEQQALGKWSGELDKLIEAQENGALAHIAERCWVMNSAHGQFYHYGPHVTQIPKVRKILVMAPPCGSKLITQLFYLARESEVRLRLVSDGLVGQIFRV